MAPGITEARLRAGTLEGRRGWKALPLRQWKRPNDALSPTLSREPSSFLLPSWGSLSPSVSRRNKAVGENHSKTEYPYSSSKALLWYSWKIPVMLWCFKCSRRWVKASEHWMVCEAFPPAKRAAPDPTSASQCAFHGLSKTANYHGPRAFHSAKPQMLRPQIQRLGNCNSQDTPPPQGQLQHSVEAIWDKLGIPRIEIWAGICSVPEAIYLWGRGKWLQKVLKTLPV